jgi:chromosome segregation ATPase
MEMRLQNEENTSFQHTILDQIEYNQQQSSAFSQRFNTLQLNEERRRVQTELASTKTALETAQIRVHQLEHERHELITIHQIESEKQMKAINELQAMLKMREAQIVQLTHDCDALRLRVEELHATLLTKHAEVEAMSQQIRALTQQRVELYNQLHEKVYVPPLLLLFSFSLILFSKCSIFFFSLLLFGMCTLLHE